MISELLDAPVVVVLDVGKDYEEIVTDGLFSNLQRRRLEGIGTGMAAVGRLLMVDEVSSIPDHILAYERIAEEARSVTGRILVARGMASADDDRPEDVALALPACLKQQGAAVLWVGDERGVGWRMGSAYTDLLAIPEADDSGFLARLIVTLRVPEVFDAVLAALGSMQPPVAAPGLKVHVVSGSAPDVVASAELRAIERLAGGQEEYLFTSTPKQDPPMEELLGQARSGTDIYRLDGRMSQLQAECRERLAHARTSARALEGGPFAGIDGRGAANAVRAAGSALGRLQETLDDAFERIDGSDGLDPGEIEQLDALGLELGSIRPMASDHQDGVEVLRDLAVNLVRRSHSFDVVIERLRGIARRARPHGRDVHLARLEQALPRDLIATLTCASPFQPSLKAPLLLASAFLASALATYWQPRLLIAPLLAALVSVAALLLSRQPLPKPSTVFRDSRRHKGELAVYGLVGLAGIAVGSGIASAVRLPFTYGVAGALAAVGLLIGVSFIAWHRAVRDWRAGLRIDDAEASLQNVRDLLADVALNDWVLCNPRRDAARLADTLALALQEVRNALLSELTSRAVTETALAGQLAAPAASQVGRGVSGWLRQNTRQLHEVVLDDYVDVLTHTIKGSWHELQGNSSSEVAQRFEDAFMRELARYRHHLAEQGVLDPPPFGRDTRLRRDRLLSAIWSQAMGLESLLDTRPDDPTIVQLCAPEQLRLLSVSTTTARLVRFAPTAAQASLSRAGHAKKEPTPGTVWTASATAAGVLRLVPLRTRTVAAVLDEIDPAASVI